MAVISTLRSTLSADETCYSQKPHDFCSSQSVTDHPGAYNLSNTAVDLVSASNIVIYIYDCGKLTMGPQTVVPY